MQLPRAPEFWWRPQSVAGYALAPFGAAYGAVAARRMSGAGASVGIPVLCIGSFILGGAGKTPTALAVAAACSRLGHSPGFLTRGYGGAQQGPVIVSPKNDADAVGDEALLLARHAPTVVSADRPSGAKLLAGLGVGVVVMDDGFHNPWLAKNLSVVVVDAGRGIGNGRVFPAGPLRAPLDAQVLRADALVVLGQGPGGEGVRAAARAGLPILRGNIEPARRRGLKRRRFLAFAGIGDPAKFYATLAAAGAEVGLTMDFPDHHRFSDADCERILDEARSHGLTPITTEKDQVRLLHRGGAAGRLAAAAEVLPVEVRFEEPKRLTALIADAIAGYGSAFGRRRSIGGSGAGSIPA
jgi:tetraacyldisaccharide 4'-kinase